MALNDMSRSSDIWSAFENHWTNGPVNAHLISWPLISTIRNQPNLTAIVRVIIYTLELESPLVLAKLQDHRTLASEGEDFKGFHHTRARRPSWSCNQHHFFISISRLPKEAPSGFDWPRFQGGRCLKIVAIYM